MEILTFSFILRGFSQTLTFSFIVSWEQSSRLNLNVKLK